MTEEEKERMTSNGKSEEHLLFYTFSWRALCPWTQPEHIVEEQGD